MIFEEKENREPKKEKIAGTSLYLPPDMITEMDRICEKEGISKSLLARQAIKDLIQVYQASQQQT